VWRVARSEARFTITRCTPERVSQAPCAFSNGLLDRGRKQTEHHVVARVIGQQVFGDTLSERDRILVSNDSHSETEAIWNPR
jgi:hypothetical protein